MAKLKFTGSDNFEEYHGFDGDEPVHAFPGQTVDVSDETAARLLDAFPHAFSAAAKKTAKTAKSAKTEEPAA